MSETSVQELVQGLRVGDRVIFREYVNGWTVRATARRYVLCTARIEGEVCYTILDAEQGVRGPLNVIGWGMGIETTSGPDRQVDEVMHMLRDRWEVSHRNRVPIHINAVLRVAASEVADDE